MVFIFSACAGTRREIRLTSEPSIERAMDKLASVPEGKKLLEFLYKNPIRFEYSNTPGLCYKFSLKAGTIFLPTDLRDSETLFALTIGRAAYIYRFYAETGIEEILAEEEEAAALFQARAAIEMNVQAPDFRSKKLGSAIKANLCTYLFIGAREAMQKTRSWALSYPDADCQRPLETLENQHIWLEGIRQSVSNATFFQMLYDRDQRKVRGGLLTQVQAMSNDAKIRAIPLSEIYRFQQTFYSAQSGILSNFEKAYRQALKYDEAWNADNAGLVQQSRETTSVCKLPE